MGTEFDDLLTRLGTGKWNFLYFFATSYWYFLVPSQTFSGVFLSPSVNITCRPPSQDSVLRVAEDSCSYFVNKSTDAIEEIPCRNWDYDDSVYSSTLTSDFDLVCTEAYNRATYQSIYTFATIFSSIHAGYIADKFGRRLVVLTTQIIYAATGIAMCCANSFPLILALRFLMGCVGLPTIYILTMEVCEVKYRSVVGILTGLPWAFGTMAWGGVAYLIRDWRWLQLSVSLPALFVLPALFIIDESPRWLIVKGHHDRAIKVLQRAARWNKVTLPSSDELRKIMMNIQEETENETKNNVKEKQEKKICSFPKVPTLCRTRPLRIITVIFSLNLFISALVFGGLNLSGANYSADPFIYTVLGGLMEVPGYSLTAPLINRVGRKWPTIWGYFLSGVTILILVFVPSEMSWLVMTLAMAGKMCISGAFMIIIVYMSEMFPTEVRLQGVGATVMACHVGATIAPYITDYLGPLIPWAPSVIFGASSLVAGVALLPLHETLSAPMPDTVNDIPEVACFGRFFGRLFRRRRRAGTSSLCIVNKGEEMETKEEEREKQ
ncbi:organic cation transporter protein-like [Penaeus japonicus]|uniref:organic cation transporter protein-like n=1 Tax=Penaeus japonicus TaxID=27405 RepID=UPI001C70B583|nr:organic cation transporter protein-like [Penaeus japonicus]